jgi:hypothetical protein
VKKNLRKISYLMMISSIVACIVNNLYANKFYNFSFEGKRLYIYTTGNLSINYPDSESTKLTSENLLNNISNALTDMFSISRAEYSTGLGLSLTPTLLFNDNEQFMISLPNADFITYDVKDNYDVILFIEDFKLNLDEDSMPDSVTFKYAFWDVEKWRLIKYDNIKVSIQKMNEDEKDSIDMLIEKSIKMMQDNPNVQYRKVHYSAVSLKLSPAYYFHQIKKDEDNPNIPNEYEQPREYPSVSHFFSNSFTLETEINYRYYFEKYRISFGVMYGRESLKMESDDKALISFEDSEPDVQKMSIQTFAINLVLAFSSFEDNSTYPYLKFRICHRSIKSNIKFGMYNGTLHIKDHTSPGFALGCDIAIPSTNLEISAEAGYDLSDAYLVDFELVSGSVDINEKLSDNRIYLKLGLLYYITF